MRRPWLVVCALASFAFVGACSDGAPFQVRESVEQLHVTHATPGVELAVHDSSGGVVATGIPDAQGSLVFRNLPPGDGYVVRTTTAPVPQWSRALKVLSVAGSQ